MTDKNETPRKGWTVKQAIVLAAICLASGVAGGWAIHGLQSPAASGSELAATIPTGTGTNAAPTAQGQSSARLKEMADAAAAPQVEKLKADSNNPELLTSIGNVYYDAQQYSIAIDYYGRALAIKPSDVSVRTDRGTAYWYIGNADAAIAEFKKALSFAPTNANTLFNLGLVELQGKRDAASAVADWEKLLSANPTYEERDKVEQMISEAKKQAGAAQ